MLIDSGKYQEGIDLLERAFLAYRRGGDRAGMARVRLKTSTAQRGLSHFELAMRHAQEAADLAPGDAALQLSALTLRGRIAAETGDHARADRWLREALSMAERAGDFQTEGTVLRALARVSDARGQQGEALDQLERAGRGARLRSRRRSCRPCLQPWRRLGHAARSLALR
jgi:tetratricopeptide (TPR) repeat protein